MSTEFKATDYEPVPVPDAGVDAAAAQSTALAAPAHVTEAERRVLLAKQRLQHHLTVLDQRARSFARQSAWIAGMVLLGVVGAVAASSVFRSKPKRSPRGIYYAERDASHGVVGRTVGSALIVAAFGLLSRGARSFVSRART